MKVVTLDDIESLSVGHLGLQWKPVRHALDVSAFGINAYHGAQEGDLVVEEHADPHQELYLVARGRARFRSGEEEFDAPAGTFVLFEPREHRVAHAAERDTVVVAIGAEAGRFEPSGWEYAFRGKALFDAGRHAEARAAVLEGLTRYPERADLLYTRACLEADAGDRDAAVASLLSAAAGFSGVLDWAGEEKALAPIRDDPRVVEARDRPTT
jgi:mannose-6-phosphate isomerase-like protein (cupin superfamily)